MDETKLSVSLTVIKDHVEKHGTSKQKGTHEKQINYLREYKWILTKAQSFNYRNVVFIVSSL